MSSPQLGGLLNPQSRQYRVLFQLNWACSFDSCFIWFEYIARIVGTLIHWLSARPVFVLGMLLWIEALSLLAGSTVEGGDKVFRRHLQINGVGFSSLQRLAS